jgi:hypothetical protein
MNKSVFIIVMIIGTGIATASDGPWTISGRDDLAASPRDSNVVQAEDVKANALRLIEQGSAYSLAVRENPGERLEEISMHDDEELTSIAELVSLVEMGAVDLNGAESFSVIQALYQTNEYSNIMLKIDIKDKLRETGIGMIIEEYPKFNRYNALRVLDILNDIEKSIDRWKNAQRKLFFMAVINGFSKSTCYDFIMPLDDERFSEFQVAVTQINSSSLEIIRLMME